MFGHVARMGDSRSAYRVLVGRPDGKRSLGRHRLRWKIEIKMYLEEVEKGYGLEWSGRGQGKVACCFE